MANNGSRETAADGTLRSQGTPDRRAVSEVVGVVVLFGMVIVGVGLILVSGFGATQEVQDSNEFRAAEVSMQDFRGRLSSMAYENDSAVKFELAGDNTEKVGVVEDGSIEFALNGRDACTANRSMGMVKFEQDDGDVVAYQANGVWKKTDENGSVMVESPNIQYRKETIDGAQFRTLNYPIVNVNASKSDPGRSPQITVRNTGEDVHQEMERAMCLRGPNTNLIDSVDNVTIRVKNSTFYDAWARYLGDTFGNEGDLQVYHANDSVFVRNISLGLIPGTCTDQSPIASLEASNGTTSGKYVTVRPGEMVELDAGSNDPDSCGPGITGESLTGDGFTGGNVTEANYAWTSTGEKDVTFTVWDDEGNVATSTVTVNVTNAAGGGGGACTDKAPNASLTASNGTHTGDHVVVSTGDTVDFDGTDGDDDTCGPAPQIRDRSIVAAGLSVSGNDTSHSWSDPGLYAVTFAVEDNDGNAASDRVTVRATDGGGAGGGNNGTDSDGDGVPDSLDECPGTPTATGENGCSALSRDGNGLRVNQSTGTLTVLGTQVTRVNESEGSDRQPLDVMFVLDETGSMEIGGSVVSEDVCYYWYCDRPPATYTVPAGEHWERVRGDDRTFYHPGDTVSLWNGDTLNRWSDVGNDPDEKRVDATRQFVGALNGSRGDRAGVVHFDTETWKLSGLSGDLDAVNASIDPNPGGATRIGGGLQAAVDEHENTAGPEQDVIVLLTDGENTYGNQDTYDAVDDAVDENVTIYTVGLGDDVNTTLLTDVVDRTGGEYYQADSDDELVEVFAEIAGETKDPVRRVEFDEVESSANVEDSTNATTIDLGELNDPDADASPAQFVNQSENGPGWLLSLSAAVQACDDATDTGDTYDDGGTTYNETECRGDTTTETVDRGDASAHEVLLDGDEVPDYSPDHPWETNVASIVEEYADENGLDLLSDDGERVDLDANQAVFVLEYSPGNYTVALFEADDTSPPSANCVDDLPSASLDVDPGTTVSPGTEVSFDGTATPSGADTCGTGSEVTGEDLTYEFPGGTRDPAGTEDNQTYGGPGQYNVTYEVTDNDGNVVTVTDVVTVTATGGGGCIPDDPTVTDLTASSTTVATGEDVSISGTSTDGDACGPGIVSESLTGPGVNAVSSTVVSWSTTGTKTVWYNVTDDEDQTAKASIDITVVSGGGGGTGSGEPDNGFVIGIGGDEVVVG